jgi:predicted DNA-binding transcriptional regulator AlpA
MSQETSARKGAPETRTASATAMAGSALSAKPEPATAGGGPLLAAREAAGLLTVGLTTFWKMHSAGRLPAPVRLTARTVRWRREELGKWIAAGCPKRDEWTRISGKST